MSKPTTTTTAPVTARKVCLCGCDLQVAPKASWLPGHDARAAGVAARAALAGDASLISALPSEKLQAKATTLAAKWTAEATAKAERKAEREAAKQAKVSA